MITGHGTEKVLLMKFEILGLVIVICKLVLEMYERFCSLMNQLGQSLNGKINKCNKYMYMYLNVVTHLRTSDSVSRLSMY